MSSNNCVKPCWFVVVFYALGVLLVLLDPLTWPRWTPVQATDIYAVDKVCQYGFENSHRCDALAISVWIPCQHEDIARPCETNRTSLISDVVLDLACRAQYFAYESNRGGWKCESESLSRTGYLYWPGLISIIIGALIQVFI